MRRYADRLRRRPKTVRIVGPGTDLTLSIAGREGPRRRRALQHAGRRVLLLPARGLGQGRGSSSEFPAVYQGQICEGVRARFEGGQVVDASARAERGVPDRARSTPTRARAGSGSSGSAATRESSGTRSNTLFDEKIDGTIHLASVPGSV
jgi:leucyl aminopeptidase (aminopeptidase T)